jgi:transposase
MIDSGDPRAKHLGCRLRRATCELFEHWADYRAGKISRFALLRRMAPVRRKVEGLLLRGAQSGNPDVRGTCRELHGHRQGLWAFLHHENVEPTNNAGERSLRHAVIWRKLSFGTQSVAGSRFVEAWAVMPFVLMVEETSSRARSSETDITLAQLSAAARW